MQEMSFSGAKVLNSQAIEFAKKSSIAIYARASFDSSKETFFRKIVNEKLVSINSVVFEKNILRVKIQGRNISKKLQKAFLFSMKIIFT